MGTNKGKLNVKNSNGVSNLNLVTEYNYKWLILGPCIESDRCFHWQDTVIVRLSLDVETFKLLVWKYTAVFLEGVKRACCSRSRTSYNNESSQINIDIFGALKLNLKRVPNMPMFIWLALDFKSQLLTWASTYQKAYKVGCAFPMVISSDFQMDNHRDNDHDEDTPYFNIKLSLLTCWNKNNNSCINFLFVLFPHIGFFAVARLRILLLMLCNNIC